jgi:hypothetical protein
LPLRENTCQEYPELACGKRSAESTELLIAKGGQLAAGPFSTILAFALGCTTKEWVKVSEHPFWLVTIKRAMYVESNTPLFVSVQTGALALLIRLQEDPNRVIRQSLLEIPEPVLGTELLVVCNV